MNFINEIINKKYNTNKGYMYFIDLIKERYPEFKINYENLTNLTICEMTQSYFQEHKVVAEYVASRNEIKLLHQIDSIGYTFTEEELVDSFLHELIHAITSRVDVDMILEGINQRNQKNQASYFVAINEGITQLIANDLLGKVSDAYLFETNVAEQLAIILGKDKLFKIYSENNTDGLIQAIYKIDEGFNIRKFIINVWASYMVINGFLTNGEEYEDTIRVTEIQKQLLSLYLKTTKTNYSEYLNIMLDSEKADEIVNPRELRGRTTLRDINELGFLHIDSPKNSLLKKIKESALDQQETQNINRKEEMLEQGYKAALEMVTRIQSGKIIKDVVDDKGERIVVTLTCAGTYGYQVFERLSKEPHYFAESFSLIDDLKKNTDHEGRGLRYTSAKSRVQRNLTGVFTEYILDRGYHSFYINLKFPKDSNLQVSQRMSGYDRQDPVVLLGCQFDRKTMTIVADAQQFVENGVSSIRLGLGAIKDDGTIDYNLQYKIALEAEMAKQFLGEKTVDRETIAQLIIESSKNAQALFYDVYRGMDIPIIDGVVSDNLISSQVAALFPTNNSENPKLN